ncbi:putative RNA methyltransferase [Acinetobacter sp.]|uniref:putative RNA methyltransferase n=1 Tax=Acinetobacter sp. TaxID=472 RepID=UPI0031DA3886
MQWLMCPVCRENLSLNERTWRCQQGHSFDLAKQGYVNLHVVQHKHSKQPGDTPEAVDARRAFLSAGFYAPLRTAVETILQQYQPKTLLDIGCGEGYYTQAMQAHVQDCIGVDIAKNAVQRAAKANPNVTWVVGTGAVLPVLDGSMEICTSLFSPIPQQEILRVLKEDGLCLVVTPAPQHLYAMREALFDQVNPHEPEKFVNQLSDAFELIESQVVDAPLLLKQQDIQNLLAMTPYAYKAKPEKRQALETLAELHVTASFQIYLFKKKVEITAA